MTKRPYIGNTREGTYVVFVLYPGSTKEYAYLCNIPGVQQGDEVLANNDQRVKVVRTANFCDKAIKYVRPAPDAAAVCREARRREIHRRLGEIKLNLEREEIAKKLASRSPEAKKLLIELKKLGAS